MLVAVELLRALFGELARPEWTAQRYEAKADRLFRRWLRLPSAQRTGPKGERMIDLIATYNLRAQTYRRMID